MNTFAIFLRGINIGGHAPINMLQLKQELQAKGFSNIKTHLNSGNLIVTTLLDAAESATEIAGLIKTRFDLEVKVFVITQHKIKEILEKDPFQSDETPEPSKKIVFLLSEKISEADFKKLFENHSFEERCIFSGDVLYAYYPNGSGTSKFNGNFIERKLKVKATARNWNTISAMASKMEDDLQ